MSEMAEFWAFYKEELRPILEEFEVYRKSIVSKIKSAGIFIGAGTILLGVVLMSFGLALETLLFPAVLGIVAFGFAWRYLTKDYVSEFKNVAIHKIIRFVDPNLRYDPKRHISLSTFRSGKIFQHRIDRFRGEDYVAGKIGKTDVEFSEVHAEYKTRTTDSKGRSRTEWHTIFKGLYFTADFNKHFQGTTLVLPDRAERLLGFLGKKLQSLNFRRDQLIQMEDPEFEKLFVVYGTDQIEARYILSPSLMRRITEFKKKTGLPLYLSFVSSRVHVALSTGKNMFEPKVFSSLLKVKLVQEYYEDLKLATGIVEDLNLNTRIWTKE